MIEQLRPSGNVIVNIANEHTSHRWSDVADVFDFRDPERILDLCRIVHEVDPDRLVGGGYHMETCTVIGRFPDCDVVTFDTGRSKYTQHDSGECYDRLVQAGVTKTPIVNVELFGGWSGNFPRGVFPPEARLAYENEVRAAASRPGLSVFFHSNPWCQHPELPMRYDLGGQGRRPRHSLVLRAGSCVTGTRCVTPPSAIAGSGSWNAPRPRIADELRRDPGRSTKFIPISRTRGTVIDSHQHIRTEDLSTPEKRREYAEWLRNEMECTGIERFTLMPYPGEDLPETVERNKNTAKLLEEHPDLGYAWVYIDPRWGEGAVKEFRRAVREDGFVGLKHHSNRFYHPISDPEVAPLLEAADDMDVPVIGHVTQRTREHREEIAPYETQTEHVREVAERYPDLDVVSGHIGAGGDWERRIRNLTDLDNVYLDISGTDCEQGQVEMAAEYLGTDRLVFGTDGWLFPDTGKLMGCDLTPERKAEIAYNFERLVPESTPNKLDDLEAREAAAVERFERFETPREETIVDANAFVGSWPYCDVEGRPDELLDRMDAEGIDKALVSSLNAVHMRNVPKANHQLFDRLEGHEDRLIPVATVDPTYTKWEQNLDECVDRGAKAVKMLPLYHGYDLDEEPVRELVDAAAERDLPVILCSVLEDLRKQHPTHKPRGSDEMFRDRWNDEQVDAIIDLLKDVPDADVILDNCWVSAPRILEETSSRVDNHWVRNAIHDGRLLFNIDGLFVYYESQAKDVAREVGIDHLAFSAQLPFNVVQAYYNYVEYLPVDEDAKDRVRAENVLDLVE